MANSYLKTSFIDYWDEVVRQWLDHNSKDELFTEDAEEQHKVINAINENCKNSATYKLNTNHMPEPYWGNPLNCSIVLLDYNPAGGPDDNRHTTIIYKDGDEKGMTLIKHVKDEKSYSSFAKKCPVFRDADDLKEEGMGWFCDEDNGYEGYHWWQNKRGWLDHLVEAICGKKDEKKDRPLPFGMELCGWHSKKWSSNMAWIDSCRDIIDKRAIKPLLECLKLGPKKMAVCIGAKFDSGLLSQFFNDKNVLFEDVTTTTFEEIDKKALIDRVKDDPLFKKYEELTYSVEPGNDNIHVIAKWKNKGKEEKPKNRYYRIYKITEDNKSYYILNTFAPGSNHHPGKHFWPFEKVLIEKMMGLN